VTFAMSSANDVWQALLDLDAVRRLVRDGLGCQCPDAIFEDVVVGRPTVFIETDPRSAVQLLVGRRLLVSFVETARLVDVHVDGERLLLQGREIRDAQGLSRFRLVLVGSWQPRVVEALAERTRAIDDRLHVHAMEPEALAALVQAPG